MNTESLTTTEMKWQSQWGKEKDPTGVLTPPSWVAGKYRSANAAVLNLAAHWNDLSSLITFAAWVPPSEALNLIGLGGSFQSSPDGYNAQPKLKANEPAAQHWLNQGWEEGRGTAISFTLISLCKLLKLSSIAENPTALGRSHYWLETSIGGFQLSGRTDFPMLVPPGKAFYLPS